VIALIDYGAGNLTSVRKALGAVGAEVFTPSSPAEVAAAAGVIVSPGRPFFAAEPTGPFLRVTFAAEPPDRLAEGAARLKELIVP